MVLFRMGLKKHLLKPIVFTVSFLFIVTTIDWFLFHRYSGKIPFFGTNPIPPELIEAIKKQYPFYFEPLYIQYIYYISNLMKGKLGYSYTWRTPVSDLIIQQLIPTLILLITAFIIGIFLVTKFGIFSIKSSNSNEKYRLNLVSTILKSIPPFWM